MDLFNSANEIKITKVEIENYRSIEKETFEISPKGITISGENGLGKTTRIEAILWVFTGTLFDNTVNGLNEFLKPVNSPNETVTSVQITLSNGGDMVVLTKTLREKWVKRRGTEDVEFDGVEVKYYFNGVEISTQKEWSNRLYKLFGLSDTISTINSDFKLLSRANMFNLLMNLEYFKTLDNKTLRELIILVVGNVDFSTMEMSENLRKLLVQKNNDFDDLKKSLKQTIKAKTTEIENKKVEIETVRGLMSKSFKSEEVNKSKEDIKIINQRIMDLKIKQEQGEKELTQEITNKIIEKEAELEREISKSLREDIEASSSTNEYRAEVEKQNNKWTELKYQLKSLQEKHQATEQAIGKTLADIEVIKARGKSLLERKKSLEHGVDVKCPKCEHSFELDLHEGEKAKITLDITAEKTNLDSTKEALELFRKEEIKIIADINEINDKIKNVSDELREAEERLKNHEKTSVLRPKNDFDSEQVSSIRSELNRLKIAKNDISLEYSLSQVKTKTEILNLEVNLEKAQEIVSKGAMYEVYQGEISTKEDELKAMYKSLTVYEQIDMEFKDVFSKYLMAFDKKVKTAFGENIKFKMFEENISNDNITATCEMYFKDSKGRWVNAINGINTGHAVPRMIEFISFIKKTLGVKSSFLIVDFFETVGNEALSQSLSYGEQLIVTQVVRNQNEIKMEGF
jgi:DNA repair exonuclease SbcCD ATPase subunit